MNTEKITERQLAFIITTHCTLNCKHCADMIPYFKKLGMARHTPLADVKREVEEVFKIYDYISDVTVTGGETLLHPQLCEILEFILSGFDRQFDSVRIFTNGTIVPSEEILELMRKYKKLSFTIDDYGPEKSNKADQIKEILSREALPYRVHVYYGDGEYCGGWINFGSPSDFHNYSKQEVDSMYKNCHNAQYKALNVYEGKMLNCCWAVLGSALNLFPEVDSYPYDDQIIDLFDTSVSLEDKRLKAALYGSAPHRGCQFCNGFDPEKSLRIVAAEQVTSYDDL